MSNKIMKSAIMLIVLMLVMTVGGFAYAKVVQQQQAPAEKKDAAQLVKKGTVLPNLTLFYAGELQGWITPCG